MYFDRRLFAFTTGMRWRIFMAAAIGIFAVPVAIWRLTLTGETMARLFQGTSLTELVGVFGLIAILIVLRAALQLVRDGIAHNTAAQMKVRLRHALYAHALQLGPAHFDQRRTGETSMTLVDGVETMETFYGVFLPQFIISALAPFMIFGFMAFLDLRTAFVFLAFAVLTLFAPLLLRQMNRERSERRRVTGAALAADFLDSMQGLPTLKVFGQSGARGDLLTQRARDVYRSTMRLLAANIATSGVTLFCMSAGAAVALCWGAIRVSAGTLDLRTLMIVLLLGVEVFRPLRDLTVLFHQGMLATAAARGIFDFFDAVPEVTDGQAASHAAPDVDVEPSIRFEHVSFRYRANSEPVIRDLSFELRPGETLGVVGPSGAGKSTIVNLLFRFADPESGRVLIGGRDVREIPLDALRRHIAVVAQDTYLFHGTIAENLRLGNPAATQQELESAAHEANIHDFIARLPRGYDTVVGERGTRLSGGQRQRIAIARALLKNADILVLDEALSSVDAENEHSIQQALDRLQAGRTTLVIAHRLSSVVGADRILALDGGELVESGTPEELRHAGGLYSRLMEAQFRMEAAEPESASVDAPALAAATSEPGHAHTTGQAAGPDGRVTHGNASPRDESPHEHNASNEMMQRPITMVELTRRLLLLVTPWRGELLLSLGTGLANAGTTVVLGALSGLLVRQVARGSEPQPYIIALLLMVPVSAIFAWLDSWVAHDLAFKLLAEMRARLYRLLERLAPAYLLTRRSGDLVSAATSDVETIELFYAHTISPAFQAVLVPGAVLVTLAFIAPPLALVLLPFLVCVALTPMLAGARMEQLGSALRRQNGEINAHMVDSVQGLRTIAAFDHGADRLAQVDANGERLGALKRQFLLHQGVQNAAIESLTALGGLSVLAAGAYLVSGGRMERTELPVAMLLALASFAPVTTIVTVAKGLMETVGAARRYFAIEDEPPAVEDGPSLDRIAGSGARGLPIAFHDMTFRYPGAEAAALEGVSISVAAGETVAIVGPSGAGKTTIAHLLLRYWDPQSGRILLGGDDIRELRLDDLRSHIALVAQDTYLFNTSLWENLRLGRPHATDDEVREAARLANVDEFATALADGYDTVVGERGTQLSGGQRQRIAIARAILKDAPILILDEATSHLDTVNEAKVRDALDHLIMGRTTLIIAHRLSTIRDADKIVVLDDGRVAEHGSHQELLAQSGLYSRLIAHQLLARPDDELLPTPKVTEPVGGSAHHH